jgi:hypothetical protein
MNIIKNEKLFESHLYNELFQYQVPLKLMNFSFTSSHHQPSISKEQHPYLSTNKSCSTIINPPLLMVVDQVYFENTHKQSNL